MTAEQALDRLREMLPDDDQVWVFSHLSRLDTGCGEIRWEAKFETPDGAGFCVVCLMEVEGK